MAHFAELNEHNEVLRVIVVENNQLLIDGIESEQKGIEFCQELLGGRWVQTSYNKSFRKNFAGIGFEFDLHRDAFIPPRPDGNDWILDEESCTWVKK